MIDLALEEEPSNPLPLVGAYLAFSTSLLTKHLRQSVPVGIHRGFQADLTLAHRDLPQSPVDSIAN